MYVTPKFLKGLNKTRFCSFSCKIQLLLKKTTTKFLYVKTSSGVVVATSFLYLTVHRSIAAYVPVHLIFAQSDPPLQNRFRQILLNSAAAVDKVQLSLIGSRQCVFHRAVDEPCALPLSSTKGGSKREFLHFALPFVSSLQVPVIADTSNLVFG